MQYSRTAVLIAGFTTGLASGAWAAPDPAADLRLPVNVAAAMTVKNGVIENCRIACGGVSAVPRRLTAVEGIVKGKPPGEDIAKLAGQSATRGASPLNYNQFKIPLMANLVTRAVRDARA